MRGSRFLFALQETMLRYQRHANHSNKLLKLRFCGAEATSSVGGVRGSSIHTWSHSRCKLGALRMPQ